MIQRSRSSQILSLLMLAGVAAAQDDQILAGEQPQVTPLKRVDLPGVSQ